MCFSDADFAAKYDTAKSLCGTGVRYKCFIGLQCSSTDGGVPKWIIPSGNKPVTNTEISDDWFADPVDYMDCSSAQHPYYYYIDGSDGKIRRSTFDFNLKDITRGICEAAETQIVCPRSIFLYSQLHSVPLNSAWHHFQIHGHSHRTLWPGYLCDPSINSQKARMSASTTTTYLTIKVNCSHKTQYFIFIFFLSHIIFFYFLFFLDLKKTKHCTYHTESHRHSKMRSKMPQRFFLQRIRCRNRRL